MTVLDEPQKTTVTLVGDLTKQVLTLASALLTVTITFSKDLLSIVEHPNLLRVAWVLLLCSALAGLLVMMSLTGRVREATANAPISLAGFLQVVSICQLVLFFVGLGALAVAGWSVIGHAKPA